MAKPDLKALVRYPGLKCAGTSKNQAAQQQPPHSALVSSVHVLELAHQLQCSKAVKLLRSPGLELQLLEEILDTLQTLHPSKDQLYLDLSLLLMRMVVNVSTFDFITGAWFSSQICSSAKGTAVDQWGWDSLYMRLGFSRHVGTKHP